MEEESCLATTDSGTPKHWKLLGTILWGLVVALVFVVLQVITMFAVLFREHPDLTKRQLRNLIEAAQSDAVVLSAATFVTAIACSALVAGIIKLKRGSRLAHYLAISDVSPRTLFVWLGVLALFIASSDLLTFVLGRPVVSPFAATAYDSAHPVWILWVAFVVAAPLFEEIFFRGFLFKGFASSCIGPRGAIVLTAALWAIIHLQYDAYGLTTIFCLGILLGTARMRTGSLLVPLAMHAGSNLVSTAEAALLG